MTKVNLGVFTEIATEKVDRDLRNVDLTKTDVVIEYQEPDANDGYKWYRLYASGWIEQGGKSSVSGDSEITLPINMSDTNYNITVGGGGAGGSWPYGYISSISTIHIGCRGTTAFTQPAYWQVSGKADMTGHEILPSKKAIDEYDHRVVAFQKPTAENNYTWYRKYADGWVEQGCENPGSFGTVALPIEMANTYYNITITPSDTYYAPRVTARTTTSFSSNGRNIDNSSLTGTTSFVSWEVKGMYKVSE